MYDVVYLLNNGLMDNVFPYPLAFCTAFNLGIMLLACNLAIAITNIIIIVSRTFSKFVGR